MKKILNYVDICFAVIFLLVIYKYTDYLINGDSDLLWHIRTGDWILDHMKVRTGGADIFAGHKFAHEWANMSWGTDVINSIVYKLSGFRGIIFLYGFLIALYMSLIFWYILKRGTTLLTASLFLYFSVDIIGSHWLARPHIFSHIFIVIWFIIIQEYYRGNLKKIIWILPLLNIIWANLHQGFFYGYIVGGLFVISGIIEYGVKKDKEILKRTGILTIVGIMTFITSLITPYGIHYYKEWYGLTTDPFYSGLVMEFLSPNFHGDNNKINIVIAFCVSYFIYNKKRVEIPHIIFLLFWINQGLTYTRHLSIMGIFLFLIIPEYIKSDKKDEEKSRIRLKWEKLTEKLKKYNGKFYIVSILTLISMVIIINNDALFKKIGFRDKLAEGRFPIKAINYIKSHKNEFNGKFYNEYIYGGVMIYELYPQKLVFIDPRMAPYSKDIISAYYYIANGGKGSSKILDIYNIKHIFIPVESSLAVELRVNDNLKIAYEDRYSIIFTIKEGKKWSDFGNKKEIEDNFYKFKQKYLDKTKM